jgi:signal transduction histidine kinase/ligand-binding sensor domain-containing protein
LQRCLLITLLAVLLSQGKTAISQDAGISFEHLNSEDGLPNSTILDILQDTKGFFWFSSRNGLFRYDGYNFTIFKTDAKDSHSISENWISTLFEDREGVLYVGTWDRGLNVFNRVMENFTRYQGNLSLGSDQIRCIKEDSKGTIWIGTGDNGFASYDRKTKNFISYSLPATCANNCMDMVIDQDDNLWMINNKLELIQFDPDSRKFNFIHNSFSSRQTSDEIASKLMLDNHGNLWIASNMNGLYVYNQKQKTIKHWNKEIEKSQGLNFDHVTDILETSDGHIWIATDGGGIYILDTSKGEVIHNTNDANNPASLSSNAIYCLYSDKSNKIWAGTYLAGINIFNPGERKFPCFKPNPGNHSGNSVLSILQDKDNDLFIGTDGSGMYLYPGDKFGYKFTDFKPNPNDKLVGSPEVVNSICQTKDGTLWLGTWNRGLVSFSRKSGKFTYLGWDQGNPEKLSGPAVWTLKEDGRNLLWIAVWPFGIDVYDWKKNRVTKRIRQTNGFKGKFVSRIFTDSKGRVWIATYDEGLNRYIPGVDSFENYHYNSGRLKSLSSNQISDVFEDSKGTIWIGTLGGGLNKYNEATDDFTVLDENNGLISNEIKGILEDSNGNFWISSNKGIFKFSPTSYRIRNYDTDDGLQGNEFNDCAVFKARDGKLYFGGTKGFNAFYPEQIVDNTYQTPLYITAFSIFNEPVRVDANDSILHQSIIETRRITLPYKKSVLTFEFSALNFNHSKKNQYAYRMENFETNWNYVNHKRYATYTNLDPGKYTFMVKATNNDGIWNEKPTTLEIIVTPPFWKTTGFRIALILFITGLLLLLFNWRTRRLKLQKERLEISVRERTNDLKIANTTLEERQKEILQQSEELKATLNQLHQTQNQLIQSEKMASLGVLSAGVAHEINNPLNYIMGAYEGLDDYFQETGTPDPKIPTLLNGIKTGIDRVSQIVKGLNQFSRNNDTLAEDCDIHSIIDNCLVMLNNQMGKRIKVTKNYTDEEIRIAGNVGKIHQVFINILSNAIQAIEKEGFIGITTSKKGNKYRIEIADTGCGIPPEILPKITDPFFTTKDPGKGTGLGLSITYNIIRDHKGTIEFYSEPARGTLVKITLPQR